MTLTPPTGTVTFLFTDIEGSTALWERQREAMQAALARHHTLLRAAIEGNGGHVFNIRESLTLNVEAGDKRGEAACLAAWVALLAAKGQAPGATRFYGAVASLLDSIHARMLPSDQNPYDRSVAALRAQLDSATFSTAWAEGRALTLEQAIALALDTGADPG